MHLPAFMSLHRILYYALVCRKRKFSCPRSSAQRALGWTQRCWTASTWRAPWMPSLSSCAAPTATWMREKPLLLQTLVGSQCRPAVRQSV